MGSDMVGQVVWAVSSMKCKDMAGWGRGGGSDRVGWGQVGSDELCRRLAPGSAKISLAGAEVAGRMGSDGVRRPYRRFGGGDGRARQGTEPWTLGLDLGNR